MSDSDEHRAMSNETVRLIASVREGDQQAQSELFTRLYDSLIKIARAERYRWQGNLTMNATAVLNEAYLKMTDGQAPTVNDRSHFLAIAGKAMRQILQDYARSKQARKRGGDLPMSSLDEVEEIAVFDSPHVMDITLAINRIEKEHPELVQVVECRFFAAMTIEETADALNVGLSTVKRRWLLAQSMLYSILSEEEES